VYAYFIFETFVCVIPSEAPTRSGVGSNQRYSTKISLDLKKVKIGT